MHLMHPNQGLATITYISLNVRIEATKEYQTPKCVAFCTSLASYISDRLSGIV